MIIFSFNGMWVRAIRVDKNGVEISFTHERGKATTFPAHLQALWLQMFQEFDTPFHPTIEYV